MISWCRCSWPCTQGVGPLDPVDPVSAANSVHAGVQVATPTHSISSSNNNNYNNNNSDSNIV
jgi:hypothetical protein